MLSHGRMVFTAWLAGDLPLGGEVAGSWLDAQHVA